MASDWVTAVVETPYLIVPVVAWLWARAEFPQINWQRVASGALLTLGGKFLNTLILALGPFMGTELMTWPSAIISLVATVSTTLGLAIIGGYVLLGALSTWK